MSPHIILTSSDGEEFKVDKTVVMHSDLINKMIDDGCNTKTILIPKVNGKILKKIIEYCKKHAGNDESEEELIEFDDEFVNVDLSLLVNVDLSFRLLVIILAKDIKMPGITEVLLGTLGNRKLKLNVEGSLSAVQCPYASIEELSDFELITFDDTSDLEAEEAEMYWLLHQDEDELQFRRIIGQSLTQNLF